MSKDNIAQQYNNMVASIEDAKIYDGRGEYNLYECNLMDNNILASNYGLQQIEKNHQTGCQSGF